MTTTLNDHFAQQESGRTVIQFTKYLLYGLWVPADNNDLIRIFILP